MCMWRRSNTRLQCMAHWPCESVCTNDAQARPPRNTITAKLISPDMKMCRCRYRCPDAQHGSTDLFGSFACHTHTAITRFSLPGASQNSHSAPQPTPQKPRLRLARRAAASFALALVAAAPPKPACWSAAEAAASTPLEAPKKPLKPPPKALNTPP